MKVPCPVGPLGRCMQRPAAKDVMDCCDLARPAARDVMDCCGLARQGEVALLEELLSFTVIVPYPISPQGRRMSWDRCTNMPAATDEACHHKHHQKRKLVIGTVKSSFAIYKVFQDCRGHPSVADLPEPKTPDPCRDIGNKTNGPENPTCVV